MVLSGTKMQGVDGEKSRDSRRHRLRLLEGFAAAVSERGYAATTIAHIVEHARVSKRTFYEHFADKEECFLALYAEAAASAEVIRPGVSRRHAGHGVGGADQQRCHGDKSSASQSQPELARTFLLDFSGRARASAALRGALQLQEAEGNSVDQAGIRRRHVLLPL